MADDNKQAPAPATSKPASSKVKVEITHGRHLYASNLIKVGGAEEREELYASVGDKIDVTEAEAAWLEKLGVAKRIRAAA